MVGTTTTSSATSLNFVGFEEMRGKGTPALLYNQVFIMPNLTQTAGRYIHPVAGFVPGQQSYLKSKRSYYNKPSVSLGELLKLQGRRTHEGYG